MMVPEVRMVGERKVQRSIMAVLWSILSPQLVVAGCNNDGVIDVCTHLDGADDQVAHEVQRRVDKSGDGEVDPDRPSMTRISRMGIATDWNVNSRTNQHASARRPR